MNRKIGHTIVHLKSTDSTNEEVSRRLATHPDLEAGIVVLADNQTDGKGLGNNSWHGEAGLNLTLSILLRPEFLPASRQFDLNMAVSMAAFELIKTTVPDAAIKIKWPNDLYAGRKKIGGILIRHTVAGESISNSIIGIGINVNQRAFPETLPNPVSLTQLMGKPCSLDKLLQELLFLLNNYYQLLKDGHEEDLKEAYKSALFGFYKWLKFKKDGIELTARITGVSEIGLLQLETKNGHGLECDLKEVAFVI